MIIYLFDEQTGFYAGEAESIPGDAPGSWSYPRLATPAPPPGYVPDGKAARWNGTGWEVVDAPTLDEIKQAKIAAIDSRTAELITAGFSFAGKRFSMSEAAQRNWIALSGGLANGMLPFPLAVSTVDESSHALASAEELRAFLGAYLLYQADPNQPLGSGRALKELAAAATTIGEVNAIVDDRE